MYNVGSGVGYKYGINPYFTDAYLGRDPKTPTGWTGEVLAL